jgi:hypothetical protein
MLLAIVEVNSMTPLNPPNTDPPGWLTTRNEEVEKARVWEVQPIWFPHSPRGLCDILGVNWLAACTLFDDGWLSFNPRTVVELSEKQETELRLLGSMVAAGCDTEMLARLLHGLKRPYQYRPGSLCLDWANARWRLIPGGPQSAVVVSAWIDALVESGDRDQLESIACSVAYLRCRGRLVGHSGPVLHL